METYLALMFCKKEDLNSYAPEVMNAIKSLAGNHFKRGADSTGLVTIAFKSDKDPAAIVRTFQDLWRTEQRTWVLRLDNRVLIDRNLMEWAAKE